MRGGGKRPRRTPGNGGVDLHCPVELDVCVPLSSESLEGDCGPSCAKRRVECLDGETMLRDEPTGIQCDTCGVGVIFPCASVPMCAEHESFLKLQADVQAGARENHAVGAAAHVEHDRAAADIPFMFADAGVDESRCRARVWTSATTRSIFAQCRPPVGADGMLCVTHAKKTSAANGEWRLGLWDPDAGHRSLPAIELAHAQYYAGKRAEAAGHVRHCASAPSGTASNLRVQRPYVSFGCDDGTALRQWSDEAIALPPHPCMLCNCAFSTEAAWRKHVEDVHHGEAEYRKRLFYLASRFESVGATRPQLWRHVVDAFSEEYVTGSRDWPSCALPEDGVPRPFV
jgi:hypothetical protein